MNIDNIFSLFEPANRDELSINALNQDDLKSRIKFFDEFRNHPVVWVGIFHKLISDNLQSKALLTAFKTALPDVDINDIKNAGESIIYTKAYEFISNLNIERDLDLQVLKNNSSVELLTSINLAISYFEEVEEYEKCTLLFNIKSIISKSLT